MLMHGIKRIYPFFRLERARMRVAALSEEAVFAVRLLRLCKLNV